MGAFWLGVDDTDSRHGGCTTHVLTELLRLAGAHGLSPIGAPRLVRLNPNIPWKTRGNGALSVRLGHGRGAGRPGGVLEGAPLFVYDRGAEPTPAEVGPFFAEAWRLVTKLAPDEPGTDPALVVCGERPAPDLYWRAVRGVVDPAEAEAELGRVRALRKVRGERRGLVGATAAIAWPGRRHTWELLAYRTSDRIGSPRSIDPASVRAAQRDDPRLFLCHDPTTRRLLVAPHTDCPVLFGLRATDPDASIRALEKVRSEPWARWVVFRTNQGTGDHLVRASADQVRPYTTVALRAEVSVAPERLAGGHVRFVVRDPGGLEVPCLAFEPTKALPRVAAALVPGDRVVVWGSARSDATLRLEAIEVVRLAPRLARTPPPCPDCGRTMRSWGRARGFRCPRCRTKRPPEDEVRRALPAPVKVGTYHPTPSARRHLAVLAPEPEGDTPGRPP